MPPDALYTSCQAEYAAKLDWAKSHHLALKAPKHRVQVLSQKPVRKYEIEVPAGAKGGELIHVVVPGQKKLQSIRSRLLLVIAVCLRTVL